MSFDSGSMRAHVQRRRQRAKRQRVADPILLEGPETGEGEIGEGVSVERSNDLPEIVANLSVAEVIELAESGMAELEDIIAAERVGKSRKTVLALVKGENGSVYAGNSKSVSVTESNPFA